MNTTSDLKNMENEEKSFIFLGKFTGVLCMENVSYGNSLKPQVHWFYTVWGLELLTPTHLFVVPFVMETCRHWDFFLFDLMRYLSRVFSLQNTVPFIFFLKGSIEVLRVQRVFWQLEVSSQFILSMLFTQMLLKVFSNWLHGWYHPLIGVPL